jgi:lysophospholipase L1-like esterase
MGTQKQITRQRRPLIINQTLVKPSAVGFGGGASLTASKGEFSTNVAAGATVATINDPFSGLGLGATSYSTFGNTPAQLALSTSSAAIVAGLSASVDKAVYEIGVLATSGDGKRRVGETFALTAKNPDVVAPVLNLALSPANPTIAANATAGSLVSVISNVPDGVTPTITPNDGRLKVNGSSLAGWTVVVGNSAMSAGNINFSVSATGANGASGVVTVGAVTFSLRTMAGGGFLPDGVSTVTAGVTRAVGRAQIPVFATTTDMKIAFPTFYMQDSAGEVVLTPQAGTTFAAQLEDSNGSVFGAITFDGGQSTTSTFPASGVFWSDVILPSVLGRTTFAAGTTTLFVKMEWTFPASGTNRIFISDGSGGSTGTTGEGCAYGGNTTMGVYGGAQAGGGTSQPTRIFRPWLVVGTHAGVAVAGVGDSLTFGQGDAKAGSIGSDGAGGGAFARAAYAAAVPYTKIGKPADRIQYWAGNGGANSANRIEAMRYHTHAFMMLGFNDIAGGSNSAAAVLTNLRDVWARMKAVNPNLKIHEGFITLRTSSPSDQWASAAGQTPQGGYETGGTRTVFNNSLAAEVAAGTIAGTFDYAPSCYDPAFPDKWLTNGTANYPTTDGTHPRPTFYSFWATYLRPILAALTATAPAPTETYSATLVNDTFITKPATMTSAGKGPYWPCLVDYRNFAAFPADWATYFSDDHGSGTEGIWLWVGRGSDATTAQWLSYDDALLAGWFDSIASKPTANPIIGSGQPQTNPAGFTEIETPDVNIYNGNVILTCQTNNATGYRYNQATIRTVSTDGLNFVLPASRSTILLNNPDFGAVGDGHTGYLRSGPNPYPDLINPATGAPWVWVYYSLAAGTDKSGSMQWASDDPIAGTVTRLTPLRATAGIVTDDPTVLNGKRIGNFPPVAGMRKISNGVYSAFVGASSPSSGSVQGSSIIAEAFMDSKGRLHNQGKVRPILGVGDANVRPIGAAVGTIVLDTVNNKWVATYHWRGSGDLNRIGIMSGPLRAPVAPTRLTPDIGALVEERYELRNASARPAAIIVAGFGTPTGSGTISFSAQGMQSRVYGGATADSEINLIYDAGIVPSDFSVVDIYFEGLKEENGNAARKLFAGFATQKSVPLASQTDVICVSNVGAATTTLQTGTSSAATGYSHVFQGGVDKAKASVVYPGFGVGAGLANFTRSFGVRLYPKLNRIMWLDEAGVEMEEFDAPVGWDWTKRLYPFINYITTSTGTVNSYSRMGAITVRRLP